MFLATVILVASVIALGWAYSYWRHTYWSSRNVPTAPGYVPIFGHTLKLLFPKTYRWLFIDEIYRQHGGSKFCGLYEQLKPVLMVGDPELVKSVLIKDFDHFVDRRNVKLTGERDVIFNEMLTNTTGHHWKGIRSVLSPSFTSGRMRGMFPLVGQKADDLVQFIHKTMKENSKINLKHVFGCYTLEVISSCAFGLETSSFADENSPFYLKTVEMFKIRPRRMIKLLFFVLFPKLTMSLKVNLSQPEIIFYRDVIVESMRERERGLRRGDFLDLMMETRQEQQNSSSKTPKYPLTDTVIIAESVLFILAGYDTTANTLSFIAFLLAQHQDVQSRLRDEVKDILKEEGTLTYQALMECKFLDAVISESLRMYPPAHFTERQCTKDYRVPGTELNITKGSVVSIPVWSLHHDPKYWSEPKMFNPDRFMPGNKDTIQNGTYLPFGLGPRNCVGMRFALMEVKLAIAKILLTFELTCIPGKEELKVSRQIGIMRPDDDLSIRFTPLVKKE